MSESPVQPYQTLGQTGGCPWKRGPDSLRYLLEKPPRQISGASGHSCCPLYPPKSNVKSTCLLKSKFVCFY